MEKMKGDGAETRCWGVGLIAWFLLTGIPFFLMPFPAHGMEGKTEPQILILNSYHQGYEWSARELAGLIQRLRQKYPAMCPPIEDLDAKRFPGSDHLLLMKDHLAAKYKGKQVDLVVTLDEPALQLALCYRSQMFPQVPIVFAGINHFTPDMLKGHEKVTGVVERQDIAGTLHLALRLHPRCKDVLVIHDYTTSGLAARKEMESLLPKFEGRVRIRFTPPATFNEVLEQEKSLPPNAVALLLSFATDSSKKSLQVAEATRILTSVPSVPVYSLNELRLGHGIVGGMLISGEEQGQRAGDMALRILSGIDYAPTPVDMQNRSLPEFDYNVVDRFHIPLRSLPEGSIVINLPVSFFERYRLLVLGSATVVLALTSIVIFLTWTIIRRRRAENALRESEERYRSLFEDDLTADFITSADGEIIECNPAFLKLFGCKDKSEVLYQNVTTFYPETSERDYILERLKTKGKLENYETTRKRRDGELVTVNENVVAKFSRDGKLVEVKGYMYDITGRKRAEAALRRSEARFREMADLLPQAVYEANTQGMLTYANRHAAELFGYPLDEIEKGMSVFQLVIPEDRDRAERAFRQFLAGGLPERDGDHRYRLVKKDGTGFPAMIFSSPIVRERNADGMRGIIVDMTEHEKGEKEKRLLQAQLSQAQKMESVGRLAGGVAHDFNNMLSVILGHTELALERIAPSQPLHADMEEIRKAAEHSAGLTRQLLAFARKQTVSPKVLDLNQTVSGMLSMLQRLIGEDIELEWMPDGNLWPVRMDPSQIDQILANLCVNARDAISGVGRVTIETKNAAFDETYCADHPGFRQGDYVLMAVSDNGCGMIKETLAHLYEPFFTTKVMGKGTGLGLAMVYGIVKQNSGFINTYSEPAQGTTVKIYLPRYVTKIDQMQERATEQSVKRGDETILLVEDEPAILNMAKMMLQRLGYTVLAANTPADAIRMARAHDGQIHLLMTDVIMPEMNGRDLAQTLLSFNPGLKYLFMSGYTANVVAHHGILDQGVHYIQKPFSKKDLAVKIREALGLYTSVVPETTSNPLMRISG